MLSAITAWFTSQGVGLILGAISKLILDGWQSHQSNKALREAGASSTAAKVNAETVEIQDAVESVPRPSDSDVIDSLRSRTF